MNQLELSKLEGASARGCRSRYPRRTAQIKYSDYKLRRCAQADEMSDIEDGGSEYGHILNHSLKSEKGRPI